MDSRTWADIATTVGVLVALVGVMRSDALTRKGQKQEQMIFEATALRAESAARLTEDYTRRVVDALESMATKGLPGMANGEMKRGVRWSLSHHSGERYVLTNVGDAIAHDVTVTSHESLGLLDFQGGRPDLRPDEVITFLAAPSLGTSDTTITVRWSDEDDGRREWKYPLPMV